eukprot:g10643.t1
MLHPRGVCRYRVVQSDVQCRKPLATLLGLLSKQERSQRGSGSISSASRSPGRQRRRPPDSDVEGRFAKLLPGEEGGRVRFSGRVRLLGGGAVWWLRRRRVDRGGCSVAEQRAAGQKGFVVRVVVGLLDGVGGAGICRGGVGRFVLQCSGVESSSTARVAG